MKPIILYGPAGSGKTEIAQKLKELFGFDRIVDEWNGEAVEVNTLVVTNSRPPFVYKGDAYHMHVNFAKGCVEATDTERLDAIRRYIRHGAGGLDRVHHAALGFDHWSNCISDREEHFQHLMSFFFERWLETTGLSVTSKELIERRLPRECCHRHLLADRAD